MTGGPGGALAARPLHLIFIADCSGSMALDGKIQALNNAIREAIPHMRKVASENPHADVLVRVARFSSGAAWHVENPEPVSSFTWHDLDADGVTDLGAALELVAAALKVPPMTDRALPPVLVLISDGQPTDDFKRGLTLLMNEPWGRKAVRVAIGIGRDADHDVLQRFIGTPEFKPVSADRPEELARHIKWVSTVVLQHASTPAQAPPSMPAEPVRPPTDATIAPDSAPAAASPASPPLDATW